MPHCLRKVSRVGYGLLHVDKHDEGGSSSSSSP
jgi:hypothetical protein